MLLVKRDAELVEVDAACLAFPTIILAGRGAWASLLDVPQFLVACYHIPMEGSIVMALVADWDRKPTVLSFSRCVSQYRDNKKAHCWNEHHLRDIHQDTSDAAHHPLDKKLVSCRSDARWMIVAEVSEPSFCSW